MIKYSNKSVIIDLFVLRILVMEDIDLLRFMLIVNVTFLMKYLNVAYNLKKII